MGNFSKFKQKPSIPRPTHKQIIDGCKYFITKDESFCDSAGDLCFKLCNPFSNEKYTSDLCQELRTQEKFIELEYTAPLRQILFR